MLIGIGATLYRAQSALASFFADFGSGSLDPRIAFTRASSKTYFDAAGELQTAATNELCYDYDPVTGDFAGLRIDEARTNSIRNNTMVGAVAGVLGAGGALPDYWFNALSGTATVTLAAGSEDGIDYLDVRIQDSAGTASTLIFDQLTQIVAADAQTWTNSFYIKLVAGTTTNITGISNRLVYRTAAGAAVTTNNVPLAPTTASLKSQRTQNTFLASGGTIARVTGQLSLDYSGAIDITIRIGMPQLENIPATATSDKASPVIATSGAAATRAADVCSVSGGNFSSWYNQTGGTFSCVARIDYVPMAGKFPRVFHASDVTGSTDNISTPVIDAGGGLVRAYVSAKVGGVVQWDLSSSSTDYNTATGTPFRRTVSYETNNAQCCANRANLLTDTVCTLPTVDRMYIGSSNGADNFLNGWIQSITYYNRPLNALITSV